MNEQVDYEEIKSLNWQDAIKKEGRATIVKEISDNWWLFEKTSVSDSYNGLLGWEYGYGPKHRYFVAHNPAALVEYNASRFGYEQDKYKSFTDGRQVKWITRSFMTPIARDYAKMVIQQIGALEQKDIDELERIQGKITNLINSGSDQHKAAMKLAKANRETLKKKWSGNKKLKRPVKPPMPENVSATVNLLNGHTP